jgi:hypothetical protein
MARNDVRRRAMQDLHSRDYVAQLLICQVADNALQAILTRQAYAPN